MPKLTFRSNARPSLYAYPQPLEGEKKKEREKVSFLCSHVSVPILTNLRVWYGKDEIKCKLFCQLAKCNDVKLQCCITVVD